MQKNDHSKYFLPTLSTCSHRLIFNSNSAQAILMFGDETYSNQTQTNLWMCGQLSVLNEELSTDNILAGCIAQR